jgi:hypothetical protein
MTLPPSGPRPADPCLQGETDPAETVERALAALSGLPDRPLVEHVAVFEQIHVALGGALAAGAAASEALGRA